VVDASAPVTHAGGSQRFTAIVGGEGCCVGARDGALMVIPLAPPSA